MARVTVEDCILKISNRFQLVMMAAQRSRELSVGDELTVERDNDKNPVVALREIADETIELDTLENSLVQGLQKHIDVDEPMDEAEELLVVEEALSEFAGLAEAADDIGAVKANAPDLSGLEAGFEDVAEGDGAGEEPSDPDK